MEPTPLKILVVDDNTRNLFVMERVLAPLGAEVVTATSAKAGLKRLQEHDFAVALLDVQMPVMSGIAMAKLMHTGAEFKDIPIIFVTASREGEGVAQGYESGAVDYLTKPIDPKILKMKVGVFLELAAKNRGLRARANTLEKATDRLERTTHELTLANTELDRVATIDPLTQVLNRRGLERILITEQSRAQREAFSVAAILVDCDDFKHFNDEFGHTVGDEVLKEVARRLCATLRAGDSIGRIGGDEFLVILPRIRTAEAQMLAERIRLAVCSTPIVLSPSPLIATVSLGVAGLGEACRCISGAVREATAALKAGKAGGKNRVAVHEDGGSVDIGAEKDRVLDGLLKGIGLSVHWQPILRLSDNRIIAYEALSRGPSGPFEAPLELLRLAASNDALTAVDLRCLRACVESSCRAGLTGRVHVNILPSTLAEVPIDVILRLLSHGDCGIDFCLELSEQQFVGHSDVVEARVRALIEAGVKVAIDDVGTGRGTLDSVIIHEPQFAKIDRDLVSGSADNRGRRRVLERMIRLLRALGSEIIAEGVESESDRAMLQDLGVVFAQGNFLGVPYDLARVGLPTDPAHIVGDS